jgi:hypothetical protein
MKRVQVVFLAAILLLATLVLVLALRNPQAPFLPTDEDHATWTDAEPCLDCHGREGPAPQSPNHPLGRDCMRCHAPED